MLTHKQEELAQTRINNYLFNYMATGKDGYIKKGHKLNRIYDSTLIIYTEKSFEYLCCSI